MPHASTPLACPFSLRRAARAAVGAAAGLAFTGCAVIHDLAVDTPEKAPSLVGRHVSGLEAVTSIHLFRGRLLVALTDGFEQPYSLAGIAVVDTAADTVIAHYNPFGDQWQVPQTVVAFRDSLLFAMSQEGRARVADSSGVWNDIQSNHGWSFGQSELTVTNGRVYLVDRADGRLFTVSGTTASPASQFGVAQSLRAVAVSENRLYALRNHGRSLYRVTGTTVDSVDLTNFSGKPGLKCHPELMALHGNRVLITLAVTDSLNAPDTALVAVLDAATLATDTILKLKYPYRMYTSEMTSPKIVDGKMYLAGYFAHPRSGSGVEVVDLDDLEASGEILFHENIPGLIRDVLPAGPGKAYIIQSQFTDTHWGNYRVGRVAY